MYAPGTDAGMVLLIKRPANAGPGDKCLRLMLYTHFDEYYG